MSWFWVIQGMTCNCLLFLLLPSSFFLLLPSSFFLLPSSSSCCCFQMPVLFHMWTCWVQIPPQKIWSSKIPSKFQSNDAQDTRKWWLLFLERIKGKVFHVCWIDWRGKRVILVKDLIQIVNYWNWTCEINSFDECQLSNPLYLLSKEIKRCN